MSSSGGKHHQQQQHPAFRKYVLVPAGAADEEKNKAVRHAEEIKSLRHYNPTLESLATLREQFETVFSRVDIGDADKLALIHSIQKRFDALKPNVLITPPPAAPLVAPPRRRRPPRSPPPPRRR